MTTEQFKKKLVKKGFFFINQLKKNLGLEKKGSKSKDIEDILDMFGNDVEKVVSTFETMEMNRKQIFVKFQNIKDVLLDIKDNWEDVVEYIIESDNVPQKAKDAIERIDNVIDFFFGK